VSKRGAASTSQRAAGKPRRAEAFTTTSFTFPSSGSGGGGAATGGTGGGAGAGVTAALALWLIFELPGLSVLRLPAGRRGPRAQVDDTLTRPG
jgi:hypothetical protein